jgi:biofilm PGA synthesis lipoprotein PgaB
MTRIPWSSLLALGCLAVSPAPGARAAAASRPDPRPARTESAPLIVVLCYHDLSDDPASPTYTVPPESLRAHIRRAKAEGWTFLPLSAVLERRDRPAKLPAKIMVLTFDDGYRSFAEVALPILREEKVKATLSVISALVDRPPPELPPMLTWEELRRLDRSGAVEIASHGHDLHRYVISDPYGDTAPAVTAREYRADERRYETRDEYETRVAADLHESRRRLRAELGHDVRVLAWPYGEHNATARRLAAEAGFMATLGLEGEAVVPDSLAAGYLPRVMVYRENAIATADLAWLGAPVRAVRSARLDIDDLYDPDPAVTDGRVGRAIARVRSLGVTHVFLQALADPAGDGFLREAWFMNHQTGVRADLWAMVANRLARKGIKVWVRAPALNLSWVWAEQPEWRVPCPVDPTGRRTPPWYYRLSPDLAEARAAAVDFYTDLAVYLPIRGVLFDDDAFLRADEPLRDGEATAEAKQAAIRGLLDEVKAAVRAWRPQCRFGRVVGEPVARSGGLRPDLAQDLEECRRADDLVVVRAAPPVSTSEAGDEVWAEGLAQAVAARSPAAGNAVASPVLLQFETRDPATGTWLTDAALEALMRGARRGGASSLGVAPVSPVAGPAPEGLLRPPPPPAPAITEGPQGAGASAGIPASP